LIVSVLQQEHIAIELFLQFMIYIATDFVVLHFLVIFCENELLYRIYLFYQLCSIINYKNIGRIIFRHK